VRDDTRVISLDEGNTSLIRFNNIPLLLEKDIDIEVKYEGLKPAGSFIDRGMTMAVTGYSLKDPDTAIAQGRSTHG